MSLPLLKVEIPSPYKPLPVLEKSVISLTDTVLLNSADAIIMGRAIGSSDIGTAKAAWDSVTSPVISMNLYGLRGLSGKGYWTLNNGCTNVVDHDSILYAMLLVKDDPALKGILSDSIAWWNGDFSLFNDVANSEGNGTLLAKTIDNKPLFIRWDANTEFYPGAGHAPKGQRAYIGNGCDKDKSFVNYFGFSKIGKTIFFNELARMTGYEPEPVITKKEIVFVTPDATGNDTTVIDAITGYADSTAYRVTVLEKGVIQYSDTTQLNAADVVIMGRKIGSSDVGTAKAVWDSVTSPVISMNMWGLRNLSAKAYWTPINSCVNITSDADTVLQAVLTHNDPVFNGLSDTTNWWTGMFSVFGADKDGAGNGVVLAKTIDNRPLFIRWASGVEFYPGAGHAPKGDRTFIGCGNDNTSLNYFGFTAEAKKVFFAELAQMASGQSVVLPKNSNASLYALSISEGVLSPNFKSDSLSYTVELPFGSTELPTISATVAYEKASVSISQATTLPGSATVTVTAENQTVSEVYTVHITTAAPNTDANLTSAESSFGQLLPAFHADTLTYTVYLPSGTVDVPTISGLISHTDATMVLDKASDLSGVTTLTVTAQDSTITQIYTFNFHVIERPDGVSNQIQSTIQIHPNPVVDRLFISDIPQGSATVYTSYGTMVLTTSLNSENSSIDVSELPMGTYLIKILTAGKSVIMKFIKR